MAPPAPTLLHVRDGPARERGRWVAPVAAGVAGATAVANLASALTPDLAARAATLHRLVPAEVGPVLHALAVPAAAALAIAAVGLARRRRRAWVAALVLLAGLAAFDLLKGLDVEEAALSGGAAALLWWGRDAFPVAGDRVRARAAAGFALVALAGAAAVAVLAAWVAARGTPGTGVLLREALDLLLWRAGPLALAGPELRFVPLGVGLLSACALAAAGWALLRPLRPPAGAAGTAARRAAAQLVRAHGSDTLSFFKLRGDQHYLFSRDGRAFLGYRVVGGVLLVSGDPVGPADAVPGLLERAIALARRHGLRVAAVGAGDAMLELWRAAGLRTLYLGDEAIVATREFSLEGRAIRKVRQSVTRMERGGLRAELVPHEELGAHELEELEEVSAEWLAGGPERGFSMAMDSLRGPHQAGSVVVVARGEDGRVAGFLHFVPAHGRAAMSLGFMRRRTAAPNGLTEFLVVRAIEMLRARGIEELSLNFCGFGRWLREPANAPQRLAGAVLRRFDGLFQTESLLRFNAKFSPRWTPRHLAFEGWAVLPRTAIAALEAEGQLPRPALLRAAVARPAAA